MLALVVLLPSTFIFPQPTSLAQGTAFAYQGQMADAGSPANGLYSFVFTVYDAESGGNPVGFFTSLYDVLIVNGRFTVELDPGVNVFTGPSRWLEIRTVRSSAGGDPVVLSPRQRILPAPYAITAGNMTGFLAATQLVGTIESENIGVGTITTTMLAEGAVSTDKLQTQSSWSTTVLFSNPTPEAFDGFGSAVGAVGTDKVLVGAPGDNTVQADAGAAYLFAINGTLLTTFNNPTPQEFDQFGAAVAAVGSNRVLIGAPMDNTGALGTGAAYLFRANGTLLATFANPIPGEDENFGASVTSVGGDKVLIGAPRDNTGVAAAGAAFLFRTNGTLLTTFTNPTPAIYDEFGAAIAALGADRVMIGAPSDDAGAPGAGAAYLFRTNGTLLMTFANPSPATSDNFGQAVAAIGSDKVVIGAPGADAVYVFQTNGVLLATFTDPVPGGDNGFGANLAIVGSDRLLIAASFQDDGGVSTGVAYLFGVNGNLLNKIFNPFPASFDNFGNSCAAVGVDKLLIAAPGHDTGVAYLFNPLEYMPGLVSQSVVDGAITAQKVRGTLDPSQIPDLNASKITSGTLNNSRLSSAVVVEDQVNTFSQPQNITLTNDLEFGVSVPGGKEINAGKIAYQRFTPDALDIAGAGTTSGNRKIKFWCEGGATFTGVISAPSDRNLKSDFQPLDAQEVLAKVAALPLQSWVYRHAPHKRHLGPVAQDFHAAFGLNGDDDKHITTVDADGVALAAIQGLNQKVKEKDSEIRSLKSELEQLKQIVDKLANTKE